MSLHGKESARHKPEGEIYAFGDLATGSRDAAMLGAMAMQHRWEASGFHQ